MVSIGTTTSPASSGCILLAQARFHHLMVLWASSFCLWSLYKENMLSRSPHLAYFLGEPLFSPVFNIGLEFANWVANGLVTMDSLLQGSFFWVSATELCPPPLQIYKYLHFFLPLLYKTKMGPGHHLKGYMARVLKIRGLSQPYQLSGTMLAWKAETGQELSAVNWLNMVSNMHKCTWSIAIKKTVIKLPTHWYCTHDRLHRMIHLVPDTYFRGCQDRGTLLHTFWSWFKGMRWQLLKIYFHKNFDKQK